MRLLTRVGSSFAVCRAVSKRSCEQMLSRSLYEPQRNGSSLRNQAASFAGAADMRHDRATCGAFRRQRSATEFGEHLEIAPGGPQIKID